MSGGISSWLIGRGPPMPAFNYPLFKFRVTSAPACQTLSSAFLRSYQQWLSQCPLKIRGRPSIHLNQKKPLTFRRYGVSILFNINRNNRLVLPKLLVHGKDICEAPQFIMPWVQQIRQYGGGQEREVHDVKICGRSATSDNNSLLSSYPGKPESDDMTRDKSRDKSEFNEADSIALSVSKYLNLAKMPHRPTKEELLLAANGFWERTKVRFKWISIRSMRPWNADEWGAFVSWFMLGHIIWILVGTTTFFSILIFSINTVFAQETLAKWVGDYLTQSAGVTVIFESAIVPKWRNGVIAFHNVFVSRRPGQIESSVSKGSSDAAAVAAAGRQVHQSDAIMEDDGNYTQFDVTIANVNVTLSFLNWWNGRGLLKDVEVTGVRGIVDRTSVRWPTKQVDPFSYRHSHQPGDFEIETFKLEDLLLTVHQPAGFRPFSVSIYSCELPRLRKQWLFYDFLCAGHMSGSFDGSLFTIHPRQLHGTVSSRYQGMMDLGESKSWKKFNRLRIDGLKIDHLNRGVEGPFGWIYEGNVDIVADVMFPIDTDESIGKVVAEFYDQLEGTVISNRHRFFPNPRSEASAMANFSINEHAGEQGESRPVRLNQEGNKRRVIMDFRIHLNDVKAAVPLFTTDLSYVNQALVRPIVAYINAKKTFIPISSRIVKHLSDFDGSWTVFDCGLLDDASAETYEAFAKDVEDQQSRVRRFRKVGFWTLSLAIHALFMGMAGNVV